MIHTPTQTQQKKAGYTLVELLIYLGLFGILISVLTTIFFSTLELRAQSETISAVEQDGRYILQKLTQVIRDADAVISPLSNGESTNQLIISRVGSIETYQLDDTDLVQSSDSGVVQLNSDSTTISDFSIQRLGAVSGLPTLKITLTISSTGRVAGITQSHIFTTTVGIR